jgi:hypothetical protein
MCVASLTFTLHVSHSKLWGTARRSKPTLKGGVHFSSIHNFGTKSRQKMSPAVYVEGPLFTRGTSAGFFGGKWKGCKKVNI